MNIIFIRLFLVLIFSGAWISLQADGYDEESKIFEMLAQAFPDASKNEIELISLNGGFSNTALYKIKVQNNSFVLRIHRSGSLSDQDLREHAAIIEASNRNVAPRIVYISPDHRAVIMEFIEGKTLTVEEARLSDSILKIAYALQQAHQIAGCPGSGEDLLSKAKRCHIKVSLDGIGSQDKIDGAYELVKKYRQKLAAYEYSKVNVHGDLNPRNIFLASNGMLFIDWAETVLEDPFYDLSYVALKLDYSEANESILFETYLQRSPTSEEQKRYHLHKKIHQAFWSLTNLYLAEAQLQKHPEQSIDKTIKSPSKSWGDYQKVYADCNEELTAQYFYELSLLNFQLAQEEQAF